MEPGQDAHARLSHRRASIDEGYHRSEERHRRSVELIDSTRRRAREQRISARAMGTTARAMSITARAMYDHAELQFARSIWAAVRKDAVVGGYGKSRADILQATLKRAGSIYPDCQSISLTTVYGDDAIGGLHYATVASSGSASRADAAQYAFDEGPCVDAVELNRVVIIGSDDLTNDEYPPVWPRFSPVARGFGFRSVISIGIPWTSYWTGPLNQNDPPVGAINVYSTMPDQFSTKERQAISLGVHVAASLTGAAPEEIYDTAHLQTMETC